MSAVSSEQVNSGPSASPPELPVRSRNVKRTGGRRLFSDISAVPCASGKRTIPRRRISMNLRLCGAEEPYGHAAFVSKTIGLEVSERSWKNADDSGFSGEVCYVTAA